METENKPYQFLTNATKQHILTLKVRTAAEKAVEFEVTKTSVPQDQWFPTFKLAEDFFYAQLAKLPPYNAGPNLEITVAKLGNEIARNTRRGAGRWYPPNIVAYVGNAPIDAGAFIIQADTNEFGVLFIDGWENYYAVIGNGNR